MKVFFSHKQLLHNPPKEYFAGEEEPYLEVPERAQRVLDYLLRDVSFKVIEPEEREEFGRYFLLVHDPLYLGTLKEAAESVKSPKTYFYDYNGEQTHRPRQLDELFKFCYDTMTPVGRSTWDSAYWSALSALNGAVLLRQGKVRSVFALTRPPGHHTGRDFFGGYCYINNAALAGEYLAQNGKVAIFDFDYHHGNGTESIFYHRRRVLYVSIHCTPPRAYPFFTGSAKAKGVGRGKGYNLNIPLEPACGLRVYRKALSRAMRVIRDFSPRYLVVSAGFDIFRSDPDGSFDLPLEFCTELAEEIFAVGVPTIIVLEGGYNLDSLPELVYQFLTTPRTTSKHKL